MLQITHNIKNQSEPIIANVTRDYFYVLGDLKTMKCMLQLKFNVVTNLVSKN